MINDDDEKKSDKSVELVKAHLDLHQFTEVGGHREALGHVFITEGVAAATDGSILVTVGVADGADGILVPAEAAKQASKFVKLKGTMSEKVVGLALDNEGVGKISHSTSGQSIVFVPPNESVTPPEIGRVVPKVDDTWHSACLDARFVEKLAKFVRQHGKDSVMRMFISDDPLKPVVIASDVVDTGQPICGIILPTRAHIPELDRSNDTAGDAETGAM